MLRVFNSRVTLLPISESCAPRTIPGVVTLGLRSHLQPCARDWGDHEAIRLAETILESLTKGVPGLGNDGVHYQNLALTRTTARPQVLIETAFLTNKDNLRLLMTDDGRQRIANGIAAGVELFYKNQLRR